jgi:hypothetical protein
MPDLPRELYDHEVASLDPGIKAMVLYLRERGFVTTDSGDGVSKPDGLPFRHIACVTTKASFFRESERLASTLPGWTINASYNPADGYCVLFAFEERDHGGA